MTDLDDEFADVLGDPRIRRCARGCSFRLRRAGIVLDADDLAQDSYLRARAWRLRHPDAPRIALPVPFLCRIIERMTLTRLAREQRVEPLPPDDERGFGRSIDSGYGAVLSKLHSAAAGRFLTEQAAPAWDRAVRLLGGRRPADQIVEAARFAAVLLCAGTGPGADRDDDGWVRQVLDSALRRQEYFADPAVAVNTLDHRVVRALPWVAYLAWEAIEATTDRGPDGDDPLRWSVAAVLLGAAERRRAQLTDPVRSAALDQLLARLRHTLGRPEVSGLSGRTGSQR